MFLFECCWLEQAVNAQLQKYAAALAAAWRQPASRESALTDSSHQSSGGGPPSSIVARACCFERKALPLFVCGKRRLGVQQPSEPAKCLWLNSLSLNSTHFDASMRLDWPRRAVLVWSSGLKCQLPCFSTWIRPGLGEQGERDCRVW